MKAEELEQLDTLKWHQQNYEDAAKDCCAVHRIADGRRWGGGADRRLENHRFRGGGHGDVFRGRQGPHRIHCGSHRNERGTVRRLRHAAPIGLPVRREHGAIGGVHHVSGRRSEGGQAGGIEAGDVAVLSDWLYDSVVVGIGMPQHRNELRSIAVEGNDRKVGVEEP